MVTALQNLGHWTLNRFEDIGRSAIFFLRVLLAVPGTFRRPRLIIKEIYSIGFLSLSLLYQDYL